VQPPQLVPQFTVTSPSKGDNACEITNANGDVDCPCGCVHLARVPLSVPVDLQGGHQGDHQEHRLPETVAETDCDMLKGATEKNDGTTIDFVHQPCSFAAATAR
jgi:hypothetical protein